MLHPTEPPSGPSSPNILQPLLSCPALYRPDKTLFTCCIIKYPASIYQRWYSNPAGQYDCICFSFTHIRWYCAVFGLFCGIIHALWRPVSLYVTRLATRGTMDTIMKAVQIKLNPLWRRKFANVRAEAVSQSWHCGVEGSLR